MNKIAHIIDILVFLVQWEEFWKRAITAIVHYYQLALKFVTETLDNRPTFFKVE